MLYGGGKNRRAWWEVIGRLANDNAMDYEGFLSILSGIVPCSDDIRLSWDVLDEMEAREGMEELLYYIVTAFFNKNFFYGVIPFYEVVSGKNRITSQVWTPRCSIRAF